jgi:hypothetical protein
MKPIKAVYNFIVGDMIILIGIIVACIILALIEDIGALAPLRAVSGIILIVIVLGSLTATLLREALGR